MDVQLSSGSIMSLLKGTKVDKPIVQVTFLNTCSSDSGEDLYQVEISDGKHSYSACFLRDGAKRLTITGEMHIFCVIKIIVYELLDNDHHTRVLLLHNVAVIPTGVEALCAIGNALPIPSTFPSNVLKDGFPTSNNTIPIIDVTPYGKSCNVLARVVSKSDILRYSNAKGVGKMVKMILQDETAQIEVLAFNDNVDFFYEKLNVNEIYTFNNVDVIHLNPAFQSVHPYYQLRLQSSTKIINKALEVDQKKIPPISFTLTNILDIQFCTDGCSIDVMGVIRRVAPLANVSRRGCGKEVSKRELHIIDQSNTEISIALWGDKATQGDYLKGNIVACKRVTVKDFKGKSLNSTPFSIIMMNPDINEATELMQWYSAQNESLRPNRMTCVIFENLGRNLPVIPFSSINLKDCPTTGNGRFARSRVTLIQAANENMVYQRCSEVNCFKKVSVSASGSFKCDGCGTTSKNCSWCLLINLKFRNIDTDFWASLFNDVAEHLLHATGTEIAELQRSGQRQRIEMIITSLLQKEFYMTYRILKGPQGVRIDAIKLTAIDELSSIQNN